MEILNGHVTVEETIYDVKRLLELYTESKTETCFNILHLYPLNECSENLDGIHQYRHFKLVGFNSYERCFRYLGIHDQILNLKTYPLPVYEFAIFADGATLIGFDKPLKVLFDTQSVRIYCDEY